MAEDISRLWRNMEMQTRDINELLGLGVSIVTQAKDTRRENDLMMLNIKANVNENNRQEIGRRVRNKLELLAKNVFLLGPVLIHVTDRCAMTHTLHKTDVVALRSPWLTYEELATYTGYAKATLHVMQHEGLLPRSYGRGRSRSFHLNDVDAWMRDDMRGLRKQPSQPKKTGRIQEAQFAAP